MKKTLALIALILSCVAFCPSKTLRSKQLPSFKSLVRHEKYRGIPEQHLRAVADTILAYQFPSGGWSKNRHWEMSQLTAEEWAERAALRHDIATSGIGSNIDNGATTSEMLYLCRMYRTTGNEAYRDAVMRGIDFLLSMQYDNGGWPQFWPSRPAGYDGVEPYADFITFNDDAMVRVMRLLWLVADDRAPYDVLHASDSLRDRCRDAFNRGVRCILDCQIRKNGELTVWCQQYNQKTLAPEHARAYELPSFTGCGETCSILDLLMDLPDPSDEVVKSVSSAVKWLEKHALRDLRVERYVNDDGERDYRVVKSAGAPLLWARFYDLDSELPFYCGRDGIKRADVGEIEYERRTGYGWLSTGPADVIKRYYKWSRRLTK
ncbi:MAG: pectate lyase [Bacteroidales bacterium]|nr:pectate lyase [Bacteroidales bacterium]